MKIPDHVLDLMLVGAIGVICLVPHGTKATPEPEAPRTAIAPACRIPTPTPVAQPVVIQPAPPALPIRVERDPCIACGMG